MNGLVNFPSLSAAILSRSVFVLGSGMVHGAVFASLGSGAWMNHAAPSSTERLVPIDVEEAPEIRAAKEEVPPVAPAAPVSGGAAPASHRHLYPVPASHEAVPHGPALDDHGTERAHALAEAPAVVASSSAPALPRFTGSVLARGSGSGPRPIGLPAGAELVDEAAVSVAARLTASAPASYPSEARDAEIEATVPLEIVVDTNGRVIEARALARHSFGLEEAALAAVLQYRFSPAQKSGQLVRVRMRWSVEFRLR